MNNVVKLLTFIPWIIYFIEIMLYRINVIEAKSDDREKYFKYINKNFFSSLNLKELFLFFVFNVFMQFDNTLVLNLLFSAIYVYLIIDFFNSLANNCKKIKNKWLMVETVLLIVVIISFFILTKHLYITYNIMFLVSILSSFIIYSFNNIYDRIKKLTVRK